ncbi:MAG: hypothetical protein MPW15_25370 [Candidatus Manganitrophus sp.]|nr:hypothetical protein [Candidatus Manganitrophus sp.]
MTLRTKFLIFIISIALLSGGASILLSKRGVHSILAGEVAKRGILKTTDLPAEIVSAFQDGG